MFFRQILHENLGCASYFIAAGGEAAVVDPKWEIGEYLEIAEGNGFRISHILETHNHADHLSGRGRLREATGATIHVCGDAGVEYEHEPISDGDRLDIRLEAEWRTSHVPGSLHVPYQRLGDGVPDVVRDGDKPVAVACSAGNRSSIAASLLRRAGLDGIEHLADGGVADLQGEGVELAREE